MRGIALLSAAALFLFLGCQNSGGKDGLRYVEFDQSIGADRLGEEFFCQTPQDQARFDLCRALWEGEGPLKAVIQTEPTMPRVIYVLWLSDEQLPAEIENNIESWKEQNPGWDLKVWGAQSLGALSQEERAGLECLSSLQEKRDFSASLILEKEGGVIVDPYMKDIRSLDPIIYRYHFFCGLEPPLAKRRYKRRLFYGTSIIGASPHHPIIQAWRDKIKAVNQENEALEAKKASKREKRCDRIYLSFGEALDENIAKTGLCNMIFPPTYFYPFNPRWAAKLQKTEVKKKKQRFWKRVKRFFNSQGKPPLFSTLERETIAFHIRGGRWAKEKIRKDRDDSEEIQK